MSLFHGLRSALREGAAARLGIYLRDDEFLENDPAYFLPRINRVLIRNTSLLSFQKWFAELCFFLSGVKFLIVGKLHVE